MESLTFSNQSQLWYEVYSKCWSKLGNVTENFIIEEEE